MKKITSVAVAMVAVWLGVVAISWTANAKQIDVKQAALPRQDLRPDAAPFPGPGYPGGIQNPMPPQGNRQPGMQPVMLESKDGRAIYVLMGNSLFRVDSETLRQTAVAQLNPPRPKPEGQGGRGETRPVPNPETK